jgi:hypothetical protein
MNNVREFIPAFALSMPSLALVLDGQPAGATEYTVEMTSDWTFSPAYLEIQVGDIHRGLHSRDLRGQQRHRFQSALLP